MLAADITFVNIVYGVFGLFFTIAFLWVFFTIVADVFRSRDIGGVAKAIWILVLVVMPLLGALIYLVARGGSMADRYFDLAMQQVNQLPKPAEPDVITRLATINEMHQAGALTDDEFNRLKTTVMSSKS